MMSNTNGMLDAYLICQALGWEWNLTSMILIPLMMVGIFLLVVFVVFLIWCFLDWKGWI